MLFTEVVVAFMELSNRLLVGTGFWIRLSLFLIQQGSSSFDLHKDYMVSAHQLRTNHLRKDRNSSVKCNWGCTDRSLTNVLSMSIARDRELKQFPLKSSFLYILSPALFAAIVSLVRCSLYHCFPLLLLGVIWPIPISPFDLTLWELGTAPFPWPKSWDSLSGKQESLCSCTRLSI